MPHTGTVMTCTPPRAQGRRSHPHCFRHKKTTSPIPPSGPSVRAFRPQSLHSFSGVWWPQWQVSWSGVCVCVCVCVLGKQGRGEENTSTHPSPSPFRPVAQINLLLTLEHQSWLSRRASPHPPGLFFPLANPSSLPSTRPFFPWAAHDLALRAIHSLLSGLPWSFPAQVQPSLIFSSLCYLLCTHHTCLSPIWGGLTRFSSLMLMLPDACCPSFMRAPSCFLGPEESTSHSWPNFSPKLSTLN